MVFIIKLTVIAITHVELESPVDGHLHDLKLVQLQLEFFFFELMCFTIPFHLYVHQHNQVRIRGSILFILMIQRCEITTHHRYKLTSYLKVSLVIASNKKLTGRNVHILPHTADIVPAGSLPQLCMVAVCSRYKQCTKQTFHSRDIELD